MDTLRQVNRRILEAIEKPPDTGEEQKLDWLAAYLWDHAQNGPHSLDAGALCRLRQSLLSIANCSHEPRAKRLMRARELLGEYAEQRF